MLLQTLSSKVDQHLSLFCGVPVSLSSFDFICTLSPEFILEHCPEVDGLPGSFVAINNSEEAFVSIHFDSSIFNLLNTSGDIATLLENEGGLSATLIVTEEISHFHHFVNCANENRTISKLHLETLAEIQKVAVSALIAAEILGDHHIHPIIDYVFNQSHVHGTMTNYRLASKNAERFWKKSIQRYGKGLLSNYKFRDDLRNISRSIENPEGRISDILSAA